MIRKHVWKICSFVLAVGLSASARAQYLPGSQPPPADMGTEPSALQRITITVKIVLEDGSPIQGSPVVIPNGEFCRVVNIFGNGTLQLNVPSAPETGSRGARGPGCSLWKVMLPGYQTASGYVTDGSLIKMFRLGEHEGSSVSLTTLRAPEKARKAYERGEALMPKHKWVEAEKHFREAVELYPPHAVAWSELGTALEQQNRLPEAGAAFEKASVADPKYIKPLVQLARITGKQQHWEDELRIAERALALHPVDFPGAYFYHAEAAYHLGRLADAESGCRSAIQSDPRSEIPQARFLLGMILAQRGERVAATAQFREYLKATPAGQDRDAAEAEITKLESAAAK